MAQLPSNVASLVLDIETVVDGRLIQRVKWPSEPDLSPVAARCAIRRIRPAFRLNPAGHPVRLWSLQGSM